MQTVAGAQPVRLFLIGLTENFARSLARFVRGDPCIALTGVAPSLALAVLLLPTTQPEVALLDWAVLSEATKGAVLALRLERPGLRIACVVNDVGSYRAAALGAGADAVISQDGFAEEIESLLKNLFPERFLI